MSGDLFHRIPIKTLLKWILEEEKQGRILGIRKELFFEPKASDPFRLHRYGRLLETPLGAAAGPHTQLSQNIIAAWLTGARYMELKTVQVLDELDVTKPCIDMTDEGYNCEWSQELKLDQSYHEYLNAWIVLHVLKDKFGWGESGEPGFIFNMSVGYNMEGILSPTVQHFLDCMTDCSKEKNEKIGRLAEMYPRIKDLKIPDRISDNLTISTMHGCPPDEIEKIGRYFIEERKLNTTIKLNPTLLGPERVRGILNDKLGFETVVPDLAFEHDPKYEAGFGILIRLLESAEKAGVDFNIKLTNTLETTNRKQDLPKNEQMVYMSGRALHPISINLAARLQKDFKGRLEVSFSAGTDCFNLADVMASGLKPVTVCSDILKPGGYGRLFQYLEELAATFQDAGANSIEDYILHRASGKRTIEQAALANLDAYASRVVEDDRYKKEIHPYETIKTSRPLPKFDCAGAPCMGECPVGQQIPRYLDYTARGQWDRAFQTIMADNPFPNVQGKVCDHKCQLKCTRLNYDQPLLIREIKRFVADSQARGLKLQPALSNGLNVAIIGGGPSGLSCAHFLALEGFKVEVFETKAFLGGMAADGIPSFRLDDGSLKRDIEAIRNLGVKIHFNAALDKAGFEDMRKTHDFIYLAVGAQQSLELSIPGINGQGVYDQLSFLSAVRQGRAPKLGRKIAVIGGGNSAMDAARTAKRLVGADGEVAIVYRRTKQEMPADIEEIGDALEEGVKLYELCAPERVVLDRDRVIGLECSRMELGEPDRSGRPRPVKIEDSLFTLDIDGLIPAIGQKVVLDFFPEDELQINPDTLETQVPMVLAGGDAMRGASSLINAIGDGRRAAESIMRLADKSRSVIVSPEDDRSPNWNELQVRQAKRKWAPRVPVIHADIGGNFDLCIGTLDAETAQNEAARCLQCDLFCNICTTVCPNRANIALETAPFSYPVQTARMDQGQIRVETLERITVVQHFQIINLADACNECGNCKTFCPASGAPYQDKPKFHLAKESYDAADFGCFFPSPDELLVKNGAEEAVLKQKESGLIFEDGRIKARIDPETREADVIELKGVDPVNLRPAAEMAALFTIVRKQPPFFLSAL